MRVRPTRVRCLVALFVGTALTACGSSSTNGTVPKGADGGTNDAAPPNDAALPNDAAPWSDAAANDATAPSDAGGPTDAAANMDAADGSDGALPVRCGHPADCATGNICGADGACQLGSCGANACVFGYTCTGGACEGAANDCDKDADCANGSLCIAGPTGGGVCTSVANQCFDRAQCAANESCVAGRCTLTCASDGDCRDGFQCDTTHGICTVPSVACSITNDCASASEVCVGGACVPRSAGGACATSGDVWRENGCVPNQAATFDCTNDGFQDTCQVGSICLHHDCWISCAAPNQNQCAAQPILNTCKPVTDNGATYDICGTAQSLGSQCGAGANGQSCSGGSICIDGFCK